MAEVGPFETEACSVPIAGGPTTLLSTDRRIFVTPVYFNSQHKVLSIILFGHENIL